ncbi:MAG: pirin-like C-terminal cupin domain-containing protein [Roseobacter sp.]
MCSAEFVSGKGIDVHSHIGPSTLSDLYKRTIHHRDSFEAGYRMVVWPSDQVKLHAEPHGVRLMLLGGATLEAPRHIWWDFVALSKDKIDTAKVAWRAAG